MQYSKSEDFSRRGFMKRVAGAAAVAGLAAKTSWGASEKSEEFLANSVGGIAPNTPAGCMPDAAAEQSFRDLGIRRMSELDRLPWFVKNEKGEVCLRSDTGLPPIIDMHSHLGWAQGLGSAIDMKRRCPVQYFYDFEIPQDLLFTQDHPTAAESSQITKEILGLLFCTPARNRTHTAANLSAEMDRMGYQGIVLHPIEIPQISRHAKDTLAASTQDARFIPFGAVHPFPWGKKKEQQLQEQITKYNIKGIKFHPEFQFIAPDDRDAMKLFEWCAAHNVLVFSHTGYTGSELKLMRDMSEPERFAKPLAAFPNLRMVFAHTGVRLVDETLAIAKQFENQVWLEIAGQHATNITYILQRYDTEKILYGSDWPFLPIPVMLARTLVATEGCQEVRDNLFHNNAARLLGGA